ncbi:hypothetical protein [Nocardioides limicola]|uniref:hypothetical protein n=1 Tax=Nocardioides limicola TaxID=2803368 RepID=UPI00193B2FEC|nr:hypothetical protein [Nocardioides sp. DJM-14]
MTVHSFHLAAVPPSSTARALTRPPTSATVPGLQDAECLASMRLGAPTVSPARMQLGRMAMFATWRDEEALDAFLTAHPLGRRLAAGWHVRLEFLRRWGQVSALPEFAEPAEPGHPDEPVVAVTLARLNLTQLPRFLRWGKPVERQVRDHPATTLALAAMRPPRTIATFSIWRSTEEMTRMVHGRGEHPGATRHSDAMAERRRKDFHHEFTTLRFRPLAEYGEWQGRSGLVPGGIRDRD